MKRKEVFSVSCKGLPEMYCPNPKLALGYAFDLALNGGSDMDIKIRCDGMEILEVKGVLCSEVLSDIMERFDDPEGADKKKFMQTLKEENQKKKLVFEKAIHLESPSGEGFLVRDCKEGGQKFEEFIEGLKLN